MNFQKRLLLPLVVFMATLGSMFHTCKPMINKIVYAFDDNEKFSKECFKSIQKKLKDLVRESLWVPYKKDEKGKYKLGFYFSFQPTNRVFLKKKELVKSFNNKADNIVLIVVRNAKKIYEKIVDMQAAGFKKDSKDSFGIHVCFMEFKWWDNSNKTVLKELKQYVKEIKLEETLEDLLLEEENLSKRLAEVRKKIKALEKKKPSKIKALEKKKPVEKKKSRRYRRRKY